MHSRSLRHAGTHVRPLQQKKQQYSNLELLVLVLHTLLLPLFVALLCSDRLLIE